MKLPILKKIISRLYYSYIKKHLFKLVIALFLSFAVAGGTAAIAWLLDPAVKKIFIEQDQTMVLLIPFAIIASFAVKGLSLYFARTTVIKVGGEICRKLQFQMASNILISGLFW